MVQIYCPNCNHQLWGLGGESRGASQSLLGERGWVEDTHPPGPGDRCPLPPHLPCESTLLPQASGAGCRCWNPSPSSWGCSSCPGELWGLAGPEKGVSFPQIHPPQVLVVTGVSMQTPCPYCHTTRGSHRTLRLKYAAEFWLTGQGTPKPPPPPSHHPPEDSQTKFPAGVSGVTGHAAEGPPAPHPHPSLGMNTSRNLLLLWARGTQGARAQFCPAAGTKQPEGSCCQAGVTRGEPRVPLSHAL